jgi:signal recognition particle receptor subunit beta
MVMPSPAPAVSTGTSRDLKIVFTGPMGAGKTTAIRAISDGEVLSTDVPITGGAELSMPGKTMTTVGLDYGECRLGDQWVLKLFGTPGQERFRFMWDILGAGAFGLIVLADNSQPDPVGEVARYLKAFAPHVPARRTVVGVGRLDKHPSPGIADYCEQLGALGYNPPVLEVDVRRDADVRLLLSVLVSMAEIEHE